MLTLNEFKELREKLKNNEIGIEFVKKKLEVPSLTLSVVFKFNIVDILTF